MSRKNKKNAVANKPIEKKVEAVVPVVEIKPVEEVKKVVAEEVKVTVAEAKTPVAEVKTEEVKPVEAKKEEKVVKAKEEAKKPVEKKKPGRKPAAKKTETVAPVAEKKPRATRTTTKSASKLTPYQEAVEKSGKKFSSIKTNKVKYPIAVNIELNGSVEGVFYVYLSEAGKPDVEPYRYDDYDVYVRADADAYAKLLEGKLNVYDALADGVLHVEGNVKKALMFVLSAF